MKREVFLLDFQDSFVHNIRVSLEQKKIKVHVIEYDHVTSFFREIEKSKEKVCLVYGPGPGHPEDYAFLFPLIKPLFKKNNFFHLGICLGHQILWSLKNYPVTVSPFPIHGSSVNFTIPAWPNFFAKELWGKKMQVQRYNSLQVIDTKNESHFAKERGHILAGYFERGITFQFHPESVGTTHADYIFSSLCHLLDRF
ncbi:MAG: hypothetical protein KBD63_02740 [Bacteriovoracaceae bacterium]|nr:hypothetical protein [Bacteriovoracaceae bacterium]